MAAPQSSDTILVVDDEVEWRDEVERALGAQARVIGAASAAEASSLLTAMRVDLVLLDVTLAGVDGFEACRVIKARYPDRFLPVLMLSARDDDEQRERGYAAGCDNFVPKPFSRRQLEMSVNAFLRIRRQEEVIRRQLNELRRLDALKDELANLVVHDLKNPLAGLTGVLYELRDSAERDEVAEIVDEGLDAALALRNTLEDMLRVRTLQEGSTPPIRASADLSAVAAQALRACAADARRREIVLALHAPEPVPAQVDGPLLRRVIANFIINAMRYSRDGATVDVSVARAGGHAIVEVLDRGPRIPDAIKEALFNPFGNLEAATRRSRRGTALAFDLARLAVNAHGGRVAALDREGGGALFRIELPIEAAPGAVSPTEAA